MVHFRCECSAVPSAVITFCYSIRVMSPFCVAKNLAHVCVSFNWWMRLMRPVPVPSFQFSHSVWEFQQFFRSSALAKRIGVECICCHSSNQQLQINVRSAQLTLIGAFAMAPFQFVCQWVSLCCDSHRAAMGERVQEPIRITPKIIQVYICCASIWFRYS